MKKKPVKSARYTKPRWTHQRIRRETHDLLMQLSAHTHIAMAALVDISVQYGEEAVIASAFRRMLMSEDRGLPFFVVYVDDKPQFVVAAKDKEAAETGMRQVMLGQAYKKISAVLATDAKFEDMARTTLLSTLSQLTRLNGILTQATALVGRH